MEAMVMPAIGESTGISEREAAPHLSVEDDLDLIAFELWQRASGEGGPEPWVDMEESILAPH
jgi:hypothetical protein